MRIPSRIPGDLSIRGGPPIINTGGIANYNYAIGGLPWLSAASPSVGQYYYGDRRIKRATAPIRKQQFDNQTNPGEQSLDGYWIRSQMSFHGGAGQLYSDPSEDNPQSDIRFWRSKNVDPWTRGRLGLLHSSTVVTGKPNVLELFSIRTVDGTGCVVGIRQNDVFFVDYGGTLYNKTTPSAANIRSVTSNGNAIFVSSADGIWKATMPTTPSGALTWTQIYTIGGGGAQRQEIAWVKDRIVLGLNRDLYELSANPAGPPAALPTPFYTANSTGWTWTSIHETSSAIYAVGSVNGVGSIFKFTLDSSGGLPVLTGGTVAATLPGGEVPYAVYGYLGNMLGIGTSRGARVAQADDQGFLTYGPLIFESASPVVDWIGRDRFLYCTYSDKIPEGTTEETAEPTIKLARIDLSLQIEPLRFAYATDMVADGDNGASTCVTLFGGTDQLAFATATNLYREQESEDEYATTGYLTTSRIRYSTLDPKNFRSFRVRGPLLEGSLGVSVIDNTGTETPVISYGAGQTPGQTDVTMPTGVLQDFMALKFTLASSGAANDAGAVMTGWQLKALPGSPRQRLITLPLLCFDFELDKKGQRWGEQYGAMKRILALEAIESSGGLTVFQDFDAGVSYDIFIEELEFVEVDPPPGWKSWGGIVFITFRTV